MLLLNPKLQINPLSVPCSFYHFRGPRHQQRPDQIYQKTGSSDAIFSDGQGHHFKLRCPGSIGIAFFGFGCHQDVSWCVLETTDQDHGFLFVMILSWLRRSWQQETSGHTPKKADIQSCLAFRTARPWRDLLSRILVCQTAGHWWPL